MGVAIALLVYSYHRITYSIAESKGWSKGFNEHKKLSEDYVNKLHAIYKNHIEEIENTFNSEIDRLKDTYMKDIKRIQDHYQTKVDKPKTVAKNKKDLN